MVIDGMELLLSWSSFRGTSTGNRTRIKGLGNLRSIHLTMGARLIVMSAEEHAEICFVLLLCRLSYAKIQEFIHISK